LHADNSTVSPAADAKLKSPATALTERSGLKLEITGWADPVAERDALRGSRVESKLRTLKRQDLGARGAFIDDTDGVVTPGNTRHCSRATTARKS